MLCLRDAWPIIEDWLLAAAFFSPQASSSKTFPEVRVFHC